MATDVRAGLGTLTRSRSGPSGVLVCRVAPEHLEVAGGEIFHATKEHSFEGFYSRLTEEARYQYTLAYVPRGTDRASVRPRRNVTKW